jgi:hypothetical protein
MSWRWLPYFHYPCFHQTILLDLFNRMALPSKTWESHHIFLGFVSQLHLNYTKS